MFLRQLGGLLFKNYLLKKRSWITTLCEVCLPLIVMCAMIGIRAAISIDDEKLNLRVDQTRSWNNDYWVFPNLLSMSQPLRTEYFGRAASISYRIFLDSTSPNQTRPLSLQSFTENTELMQLYRDAMKRYRIAFAAGPSANQSYVKEMAQEFDKRYGFLADNGVPADNSTDTSATMSTITAYYDSADTLEKYLSGSDYGKGDSPYILGAVVLHDTLQSSSRYSYEIRLNASSRNEIDTTTVDTREVSFKDDVHWTYNGGNIDRFFNRGYLFLQDFVESFILSRASGDKKLNRQLSVAPFPTPDYKYDPFPLFVGNLLALLYILAYLWPVTQLIKSIVQEKESKIKEGMKMMGLSESSLYLSWLITYGLLFGLTAVFITLITMPTVFTYSNKGYIFLFFWVFGFTAFSFCYMISCFFSKARIASNVGAVLFLGAFLLYYAIQTNASQGTRTLACLSAPICFGMTAQHIASMESAEVGIRVTSVNTVVDNFTFGTGIGMMIFDFFLYTFIGLYFSRVVRGEYGLAEPWYFCVSPKFWFPTAFAKKKRVDRSGVHHVELKEKMSNGPNHPVSNEEEKIFSQAAPSRDALMEPVSDAIRANLAVKVDALRKEFQTDGSSGVQVAVNDVSIDLYEGQIFVLLGHNGAGKTTTISMLTGMFPPTSGEATIYGDSITTDMSVIRKRLGVCPQHNILFDELTVKEHLELYSKIKGVPSDQTEAQIKEIIDQVGLSDKINVYSKALSGGMQRKLSLAIALIGDSKVVFLDEPTSGMDPFSRRFTWDLLKKKKEGRVIILTTHFMDEADQLGDRIAIMHAGEIKCCGSSLFLKSKYGVGYTLTITKAESGFDEKSVSEAVLKTIPNSEHLSNVAGEISFRLPLASSAAFPVLFDLFDSKQETLGISSYGISVTTLEEVFLRVGHDEAVRPQDRAIMRQLSARHQKELSVSGNGHRPPKDIGDDEPDIAVADTDDKKSNGVDKDATKSPSVSTREVGRGRGDSMSILEKVQVRDIEGSMFFQHVDALVRKRAAAAYRDRKTWCCTVICPAILMLFGLIALLASSQYTFPSNVLSVNRFDYPNYIPYAATPATTDFNLFAQTSVPKSESTHFVNVPQVTNTNYSFLNDPVNELKDRRQLSEYLINSYGQYQQSRYSAILSKAVYSPFTVNDTATLYTNTSATFGLQIVWNYYNNLYLRWMTGNNDASITLIDHPMPFTKAARQLFNTILSFFLAIAFSFIPLGFIAYVVKEESDKVKHQQLISGVSNEAYWLSNFIWDYFNYLIPAFICLILLAIFGIQEYIGENSGGMILTLVLYGLSVIPFTYSLSFFFKNYVSAMILVMILYILLSAILLTVSQVLDLVNESTSSVNKHLKFIYRLFPPFCFAECVYNMMVRSSTRFTGKERGLFDMDILGWPMVYMTLETFAFFAVVLIVERVRYTPELLNKFSVNTNLPDVAFPDEDEDVIKEKQRLLATPDPVRENPGDMITIKGLKKVYGAANGQPPKIAVHSLHLGIPEGQCFGYLGINGAGKTTTMKMLTGDILPSQGAAFLNGLDIQSHQIEVRRLIGYCPQFDALIETLTGREHLLLFARIKGVHPKQLDQYVEKLIKKLGLQEGIADKPAKGYSGGNKRKLSVGIALIGNPPIVFLDEPSTGMDPGSRRFMWDLIASSMKGRSVILTTHSMEECEALCHRIGIMVGGRLRCVGTIQHLRSRFGADYQLDVHLVATAEQQLSFHQWINAEFPGVRLLEAHGDSIKVRIPKEIEGKKVSIANMFRIIEKEKTRFGITDYSVSETTLEQIFIHFAKQQELLEEKNYQMPGSTGNDAAQLPVQMIAAPSGDSGGALQIRVAAVGGDHETNGKGRGDSDAHAVMIHDEHDEPREKPSPVRVPVPTSSAAGLHARNSQS